MDVVSEARRLTISERIDTTRRMPRHRMMVGLAVLLYVVLSAPAIASSGFVLAGRTSQGKPVRLNINADLTSISRITISWRATCRSGATLVDRTVETGIAVRSPTRFASRRTAVTGTAEYGRAQRRRVGVAVSSGLRGVLEIDGRAKGTFDATVHVLEGDGVLIDTCTTGRVRWKATLTQPS